MNTDILTDAISAAVSAVKTALPSQAFDVAVSGVRKTDDGSRQLRGIVSAIVSSNAFSDPLGEISTASTVGLISLLIPFSGSGGWFDTTPPQEGDIITLGDGRRYSITTVAQTRNLYYKIGARKC